MNIEYKQKYLKYKQKYIELQKEMNGGKNNINEFTFKEYNYNSNNNFLMTISAKIIERAVNDNLFTEDNRIRFHLFKDLQPSTELHTIDDINDDLISNISALNTVGITALKEMKGGRGENFIKDVNKKKVQEKLYLEHSDNFESILLEKVNSYRSDIILCVLYEILKKNINYFDFTIKNVITSVGELTITIEPKVVVQEPTPELKISKYRNIATDGDKVFFIIINNEDQIQFVEQLSGIELKKGGKMIILKLIGNPYFDKYRFDDLMKPDNNSLTKYLLNLI